MRGLDAWLSLEPPKNPFQSMDGQGEEEEVPDDESPEVCAARLKLFYTLCFWHLHLHKMLSITEHCAIACPIHFISSIRPVVFPSMFNIALLFSIH